MTGMTDKRRELMDTEKNPRTCKVLINIHPYYFHVLFHNIFLTAWFTNYCLVLSSCVTTMWERLHSYSKEPRHTQLHFNTIFLPGINLNYFPSINLRWQRKKITELKDTHGVWGTIVQPVTYLQKLRVQARLFKEVWLLEAMSVKMINQEPDLLGYGVWILCAGHLLRILLQF